MRASAVIHGEDGPRSDHLQSGTTGTDRTVHNEVGARGGSYDNKDGGVLLQHGVGAGL